MANDTNTVMVIGRLTRDMELRYSSGGMAIGSFSIAVNRRVKKGDGWADEASFFDCTAFGKTAENIITYMVKGKQIAVLGSLKQERWQKDGQNHSKVVIFAGGIQLLGGDKHSQGSGSDARNSTSRAPHGYSDAQPDFDSDIPF